MTYLIKMFSVQKGGYPIRYVLPLHLCKENNNTEDCVQSDSVEMTNK